MTETPKDQDDWIKDLDRPQQLTRTEDDLAKGVALLTLRTLGYTEQQAARMWEDDVQGREVFRSFAKQHAIRIRAEARAKQKARRR